MKVMMEIQWFNKRNHMPSPLGMLFFLSIFFFLLCDLRENAKAILKRKKKNEEWKVLWVSSGHRSRDGTVKLQMLNGSRLL